MIPAIVAGILIGVVGKEIYDHWSPNVVKTSPVLTPGQSYTLSIRLTGPRAPTKQDATEILKSIRLVPFSLVQDPKDSNTFATTASFVSDSKNPAVVPPSGSAGGFRWSIPSDPILYKKAVETPDGKAAVAQAPNVTAGFWRQPVHGGYREGYGPAAYRHRLHGWGRWPWNIP